ncbi:MAG: helix-turn-helix transcriptional regulator [Acidobacteriota bacterium]
MVEIGHHARFQVFPDVTFVPRRGAEAWVDVVDLAKLRKRDPDPPIWKAHRIDFHLFLVVTGGRGRHMVDFEHHGVEPGCLVHIAPKQVQQFDREGSFDAFLLLFVPARMEDLVPRSNWPTVARLPVRDFALIESLTRAMYEVGQDSVHASASRVRPKLLLALLEVAQSAIRASGSGSNWPGESELEAFEVLVESRFAAHRDLSWYARQLGTSARTLTRRARKQWGTGAKEYIDRRVVLEAKRMLVHTDLTVEAIGYQLGFTEATNFVKFFKRFAGTTPAALRASYE